MPHIRFNIRLTRAFSKQTRHLIGASEFQVLSKRRAFVSNISRGQIIKQDDLIAALQPSNHDEPGSSLLRGAALDVTDPEPLPEDSPLWTMPHVTITPHISGLSKSYGSRMFGILELNIKRWESGGKLVNVVDRRRGY